MAQQVLQPPLLPEHILQGGVGFLPGQKEAVLLLRGRFFPGLPQGFQLGPALGFLPEGLLQIRGKLQLPLPLPFRFLRPGLPPEGLAPLAKQAAPLLQPPGPEASVQRPPPLLRASGAV